MISAKHCLRWLTAAVFLVLGSTSCGDTATDPHPVEAPRLRTPAQPRATALTSTLNPSVSFNTSYLTQLRRVNAINDAGLVVGDVSSNNIARAWSSTGGYVTIGGLDGSTACCSSLTEVNASGIAVGWSTTTGAIASMQWNSNTNTRSDVGITGHDSQAHGINAAGDIVGGWVDVFPYQAYYKAAGGSFAQLPVAAGLGGGYAFDINTTGSIVGFVFNSGQLRAGLWTTPSSPGQDLGTLGGSASQAWQINDHGDVVGWSEVPGGLIHAFLWTQGTGMIDLNTWPGSCAGESEAFAINNAGIIVGRCAGKPVIWTGVEGMRYLPIPVSSTGGEARDINNSNQIVGSTNGVGITLWSMANQPPSADAGGPYASVEGSSISVSGAASTDPDGDALTYSWNFGDPTIAGGGSASGVSPSHTYSDNGIYPVTLVVTDPIGATSQSTATVTVSNAAPVLSSISGPLSPVPVGTSIGISATLSDAGTLDTHSATVDWDANGTSTTSAANVVSSNGVGSLSASHTYPSAGVYTVEVTLSDDDGGSDDALYQYVVVYDPSAGFVTGGGWIDSPAGAYADDPNLSGKASFGFVSRYEKGKTVPSGNTEFQFHTASMNFNSSSYEWLVIAGSRAQYKGSGKINGSGNYKFMLTAVDGQVTGGGGADRFRIKIWDDATGNIVYDNQPGDSDDAGLTTVLSGGNVVIRQK